MTRKNLAPPQAAAEAPILFPTQEAWRTWLASNFAQSSGVWLQIAKAGSGIRSLSHPEALDVALCYGWIDAQKKSGPPGTWLQRFTPRRESSIWSKINREKALALIQSGHMHPAGAAAIEHARKNGQWEAAYDAVSKAEVPPDLAAALEKSPKAAKFFKTLTSQNRYAILFRLQTAKRPETRAKRLEKFLEMLEKGETLHPQRS